MIPLASLGLLQPVLAAAAMAASSVSVLANSLAFRRSHLIRRTVLLEVVSVAEPSPADSFVAGLTWQTGRDERVADEPTGDSAQPGGLERSAPCALADARHRLARSSRCLSASRETGGDSSCSAVAADPPRRDATRDVSAGHVRRPRPGVHQTRTDALDSA